MRASNVRSAREVLPAHSRAYATALAVALLLLSNPQAPGQITITPATISAPVIESKPGTCADYTTSSLKNPGVQINGAPNPGHCVKSQFTPLFNGQPIGTQWQQLMLGPNPPKFKLTDTQSKGGQVCGTATDLSVELSARIDVSELNWAPTQSQIIGPICTSETTRVNSAPMLSAQNLRADAHTVIAKGSSVLTGKTPITACGVGLGNARSALSQKIWQLLNQIATEERNLWHDPENALAAQCAPQCSLCSAGWVGTLTCKKTDSDTTSNSNWSETQTWIIGGVPQQTGASTQYPAIFTATGGGSEAGGSTNAANGGVSWTVNVTASGTLTVSGTQQSPTFQTNQITFPFNDIPSTPGGRDDTETAFQLQPFHLMPNTSTYSGSCDLPVPGTCHVDCSWTLAFQ